MANNWTNSLQSQKSTQWCNRINTERNTKRTSGGPTKVAEMAPEKMNEHEHALTY